MSIQNLIDKSAEFRKAVTDTDNVYDKIAANYQLAGFLAAAAEMVDVIGADAAEQIFRHHKEGAQ